MLGFVKEEATDMFTLQINNPFLSINAELEYNSQPCFIDTKQLFASYVSKQDFFVYYYQV